MEKEALGVRRADAGGRRLIESPVRPRCVPDESGVPVYQTEAGLRFVRTPEDRFEDLPGYGFAPHYATIDGLRMHYVDEGPAKGESILLLDGEPTWSYLHRKMIPLLATAGFRVIAPDHIGMGKSDKPVDLGAHTFEEHVKQLKEFIRILGLRDITLVGQDWGGNFGLRTVGDLPELFARVVVANSTLTLYPMGANPLRLPNPVQIDCNLTEPETFPVIRSREEFAPKFQKWMTYSLTTPNFTPSQVIGAVTLRKLSPGEARAYDAPYPSLIYKAAVRTLPALSAMVVDENVPAWESLGRFAKPFLFLGGKYDAGLGSERNMKELVEHVPGAKGQKHERLEAGHFIQEDIGELLAERVVQFMADNPSPNQADQAN